MDTISSHLFLKIQLGFCVAHLITVIQVLLFMFNVVTLFMLTEND
jgi:hypothetical protein